MNTMNLEVITNSPSSSQEPQRVGPFKIPLETVRDNPMASYWLPPAMRRDLIQARDNGYLVDSQSTRRRLGASHIYRQWCERMEVPFIVFSPRLTRCSVEFDLTPSNRVLFPEDFIFLQDSMWSRCVPWTSCEFGRDHCKVEAIAMSRLEDVARVLVNLGIAAAYK
jgi:hypothetical protein